MNIESTLGKGTSVDFEYHGLEENN